MKFLKKLLNIKLSKAELEKLTSKGVKDISIELFELGLINFSSSEKSAIEKEKSSFYDDMKNKALIPDVEHIFAAQSLKLQKIATRERVMGAIRCSVLGTIVRSKLSEGISLSEMKSAFDEFEFLFPFENKESVKKMTVLGFVKEGALFEVRSYLGDAYANDWSRMYRFMFKNMIEQTLSTYALRISDSNYFLNKHYQNEFNKLTDKISAYEYIYNEVISGNNFNFDESEAASLA